ncbi:opsin-5-like [Megalops cyprinoides]|uniref:opsin-5-like n=1 Tax=Megalops cyprinoides TaxID=118141 RepID=UPI001864F2EE|nr:opsin-5-like [Megalops cyprinoides]
MTDSVSKYVSKLSPIVDYGTGAFLLIVAVMTIVGNGAVLVAARKRASRLKPPELLSVNLAFTDLGAAVTMYPLAIASAWNHGWLGGEASCIYYGLMGLLFGVASIMTLTIMAVVRLITTAMSHIPASRVPSWTRVWRAIVAVWLYSLLWCLFPLIGWGSYGPEPFGTACSVTWTNSHQSWNRSTFVLLFFTLCVLLPLSTLMLCYARIAYTHYQVYRTLKHHRTISISNQTTRRLTLMSVMVSAGFVVSWGPYAAVSVWSVFCANENIPPFLTLLPCLFAKSSTVYNPFIYYAFSKSFRREVSALKPSCQLSKSSQSDSDNQPAVHWKRGGHLQVLPQPCMCDTVRVGGYLEERGLPTVERTGGPGGSVP